MRCTHDHAVAGLPPVVLKIGTPDDPSVYGGEQMAITASAALAATVALLRALCDRGLLSEGEIEHLFGEAAERLRNTSALNLLSRLRSAVEYKEEE